MNELETAKAIASGALPSPQRISDSSLVALRISGTGAAERPALGELVWRDPAIWLSPETVARCNGLSVILDHPASASLNPAEYAARSIGAILYPYIADRSGVANTDGPDVWGVARVFLSEEQVAALPDMSTSPSVTFTKTAGNQMIELPDGRRCLVEGSPQLIDHVAITTDCGGVWDKKLPNSGVRSDSNKGTKTMPDENEGGGNIDLLLTRFGERLDSKLDPITKRLDALETRPVMSDATRRRDAERDAWMKEDAAQCARDDADEAADITKMTTAGESEEVATDKARKSRKDRMDKRRADASRSRSASDAEAERRNEGERADAQARADHAAAAFGERAPPPMSGELSLEYRKRLLRRFQRHCPDFASVDLNTIADSTLLSGIETRVYADAIEVSKSREFLANTDKLRKFTRTDDSGHRITEWHGRDSIFKTFSAPVMAVTKFNTADHGSR